MAALDQRHHALQAAALALTQQAGLLHAQAVHRVNIKVLQARLAVCHVQVDITVTEVQGLVQRSVQVRMLNNYCQRTTEQMS